MLGFGVLRLAQQKEREGAGIPEGCSSPAKGWAKTRQMAPPLAQSSPPGKEEQGRRESGRRENVKQREESEARKDDLAKRSLWRRRLAVAARKERAREWRGKTEKVEGKRRRKKIGRRITPEKNKEQNSWGRKIGGLFSGRV